MKTQKKLKTLVWNLQPDFIFVNEVNCSVVNKGNRTFPFTFLFFGKQTDERNESSRAPSFTFRSHLTQLHVHYP